MQQEQINEKLKDLVDDDEENEDVDVILWLFRKCLTTYSEMSRKTR